MKRITRLLIVTLPLTAAILRAQDTGAGAPTAADPVAALLSGAEPATPGAGVDVSTVPATPVLVSPAVAARGETAVTLDVGFGVRAVAPSRVTVPTGEQLRVTAPLVEGAQPIWLKDGHALEGASSHVLVINHVTSADAGRYICLYSSAGTLPRVSQVLELGVGGTSRVVNVSVRGVLRDGSGETFTAGFVVEAGAATKKMLIRAIGPTLAVFGVKNPLRRPVLQIFDSQGRPYIRGYRYSGVEGEPTAETDLADATARAGAFPTAADSADAVVLMPFTSGAFTAQVSSEDDNGGDVLIEVYEVP